MFALPNPQNSNKVEGHENIWDSQVCDIDLIPLTEGWEMRLSPCTRNRLRVGLTVNNSSIFPTCGTSSETLKGVFGPE